MNDFEVFLKNKDWQTLSKKYSPSVLAENLRFVDALLLSRKMLEDELWDDKIQTFAIELIKSIKKAYPKEWGNDWRYDAYLGYAYDLRGWDYEEKFDTYRNAAEKSNPPDPEVLMRLAMIWSYPGVYKSKIDEKEAISLLEHSMSKIPYIEGVSALVRLYDELRDPEKKKYWENVLKRSEKSNLHAPYAFMEFFKEYGWEVS